MVKLKSGGTIIGIRELKVPGRLAITSLYSGFDRLGVTLKAAFQSVGHSR
jgi:hypothetical protein